MKKTVVVKQAYDKIYASGDDSAIKMLPTIVERLKGFNAGKTGLKCEIVPGYSIADLLRDYCIKVIYEPIRPCHALIYDNGGRTSERYEIILTAKGSVFSTTGESEFKPHGHVCEVVYGNNVDFYRKGDKYIPVHVTNAISEYKNLLKKQRKYVQVKRLEMLPKEVQQQLSELINQ